MERAADGVFAVTAIAPPGACYRYRIDGGQEVLEPSSRYQPEDVHGPSTVVNPDAFDREDGGWRGRLWEKTVLYEPHVGALTPEGTFAAAREKLDYLADRRQGAWGT
jgi:maltooligosyltrehalose trehalohydrolase